MKKQYKIILLVIVAVICFASLIWAGNTYTIVDKTIHPRAAVEVVLAGDELPDFEQLQRFSNLKVLDVRQIPVQPEAYEQLSAAFPDCQILWKVPFAGSSFDNTSKEIQTTALSAADAAYLKYFTNLETIDACGSHDYALLQALQESNPALNIKYTVTIGSQEIRENTQTLQLRSGEEAALLELLEYLPDLQTVDALNCSDYETLVKIYASKPSMDVQYEVTVSGVPVNGLTAEMTVENVDIAELTSKLPFFPCLTKVTLTGTVPDNDSIYEMVCQFPDIIFHWDFEVHGVQTSSTATELILNDIYMKSVDQVENSLKYFYHLERVEMCGCGIPSEEMDALWKRHPETRFVWSIRVGSGYVRTDTTAFIPLKVGRHMYKPMYNDQVREFKYLIDMVCLDLGHMRMTDLSFLEYMPKLKYLIIADCHATDFSYLEHLQELVYLEIFMTQIQDVRILYTLKKLECLNIGWTRPQNPMALKEMTWLTHLWANNIGLNDSQIAELKEALPNTVVYVSPRTWEDGSTDGGWRKISRYYEMRDLLEMPYMD